LAPHWPTRSRIETNSGCVAPVPVGLGVPDAAPPVAALAIVGVLEGAGLAGVEPPPVPPAEPEVIAGADEPAPWVDVCGVEVVADSRPVSMTRLGELGSRRGSPCLRFQPTRPKPWRGVAPLLQRIITPSNKAKRGQKGQNGSQSCKRSGLPTLVGIPANGCSRIRFYGCRLLLQCKDHSTLGRRKDQTQCRVCSSSSPWRIREPPS